VIAVLIDRHFRKSRPTWLGGLDLGTGPQAAQTQPAAPFSSAEVAGDWAKGLLIVTLVLSGFAVIAGVLQIDLVLRFIRGSGYDPSEVTTNAALQGLVSLLLTLLRFAIAIPFLVWFYRIHKNLPSLGQRGLLFTPGWAVGFFFVPLFNLFRPFQAMREIWHGSDPGGLETDVSAEGPGIPGRLHTPPLVGWWWALFLIPGFIMFIAYGLYPVASVDQPLPGLPSSVLMVLAYLLEIPAVLVTLRLVGRLTKWQARKAELIRERTGVTAAAAAAELTPEGQKGSGKFPYVFVGLVGLAIVAMIGFAIIMMFALYQPGGPSPSGGTLGGVAARPSYGNLDSFSLANPNPVAKTDAPATEVVTEGPALVAKVLQSTSGDSYGARGMVTNKSDKTYHFVMVKVEFCDKAGQVVSSLLTDARAGDYIRPGGVLAFSVTGNGKIEYATTQASVVYSVEVK
jgi:hypothetical protein